METQYGWRTLVKTQLSSGHVIRDVINEVKICKHIIVIDTESLFLVSFHLFYQIICETINANLVQFMFKFQRWFFIFIILYLSYVDIPVKL